MEWFGRPRYTLAMRVLVLGGSVFLGRHVVLAALARGHHVTTFSRGRSQPGLFAGFSNVDERHGDRDGGLTPILGESWDAVIDTCGFVPRVVRQSCALSTRRYVFVSTVSVYADLSQPPTVESPVHPDPGHENVDSGYGGLKAASEQVVREIYGDRAVIVRPGLIGGPHDPTGRFTYWPKRISAGGSVLAPMPEDAPVQCIDVRDLAEWLVLLSERSDGGTYNAVGQPLTMGGFLEALRAAIRPQATLVWTPPSLLDRVAPWSELPLWLPLSDHAGMMRIDAGPSIALGLRWRSIVDTAIDTLAWAETLQGMPLRQVDGRYSVQTLTPEKEAQLLALRN